MDTNRGAEREVSRVMPTKIEGPIPGNPFSLLGGFDLTGAGYTGGEFFLSGTASSYRPCGEREANKNWPVEEGTTSSYITRILTRHPQDPAHFNGTVVVEWMNVSGGLDAAPDWLFLHKHLMREGAAWIGVSAQKAGIDGGGLVPGMPLKQADPARYGGLDHPGDAFAFDIFTQAGRCVRAAEGGVLGSIGPAFVERVIAIGESQSAGFLVSYVNAIDPIARLYDGFLIHGRPGTAAGIDGNYIRSSPTGDLESISASVREPDLLPSEPRVPVLVLQSETDIVTLGSGRARQPDSECLRLWEIAGASHFDTYGLIASQVDRPGMSVEKLARKLVPTDKPIGFDAPLPVNSGPQQHYVANAALAHLENQIRTGQPMPRAPRIESSSDGQVLTRDSLGIVKGGIRTPWVDVPTATLSGLGQEGEGFLFLFGTTIVFDQATLDELYPGGVEEHLEKFDAATEAAHQAGFLLAEDLEEIRGLARQGRQPSGWANEPS